jgi:hypothetical protein
LDLDKLTLDLNMFVPSMSFDADYEMDGRVLVLPLSGKGDCVLNFSKWSFIAR